MNKFGKKITSLLICTVFILTSFGTAAVFADGITTVVSEDFSNEDTYSTVMLETVNDFSNGSNGSKSFPKNANPLYGKVFQFSQPNGQRNELCFKLNNPITLSGKTENDYVEISYDMNNTSKTRTGNMWLRDGKNANVIINATIDKNGTVAVGGNTVATGVKGMHNIRIQLNLGSKKITKTWFDGILSDAVSDIAFTNQKDIKYIQFGFGRVSDSDSVMQFDNVSIITYKSDDGTSPVADKTALRAKITSIYPLAGSLSGATLASFNTALANAVSIAHNPSATSAQVTAATEDLEAFENMPVCSVYEKFDEETYEDISISLDTPAQSGVVTLETSTDAIYGKIYNFVHKNTDKNSNVYFHFNDAISLGADDKYTEISYDIRGIGTSGGSGATVNTLLWSSAAKQGLQLGFEKDGKVAVTVGGVSSRTASGYLTNTDFNNVRIQINNKAKTVNAIYINGKLLEIDGLAYPFTLDNSITDIKSVRTFVGSKTVNLGFGFDNLIVATYKSSTGAALPDKMTLRDAIRSGYSRVKAIEASGTAVDADKLAALKSAIADAETVLENIGASGSENKAAASAVIAAAINTGMSISSYYEITGVTFADASGNTSSIPVGGGKVTGFTVEKKNDMSIDFTGVLAVYNTDAESTADRLIGVAISDNLADKAAGTYTIPCDITLPNDISSVSGKIMSWNSIFGMVPYAETEDFFTQGV